MKKVTIAGKQVEVSYCFATEIGFKNLAGANIQDMELESAEHIVALILAAVLAAAQAKGEEPAIASEDIMYKAQPTEITEALKAVLELRAEWYRLPFDEPKDEQTDTDDPKND